MNKENENEIGVTTLNNNSSVSFGISCLICGESVLLDAFEVERLNHGRDIAPKICDKCKNAVMQMRKELGEKE